MVRIPLDKMPKLKNDLLLRAAKGEPTERVPVWMMRQAGRYLPEYMALRVMADFFKVCRTPELACRVSLQPLERFKTLDAVIIFCDILVIPQAMGLEVNMVKGRGPVLPNPVVDPSHMKRLDTNPDLEKSLGYVFDALNLTRQRIDGRVPLIGFCGGPWTLMAYMIEGGGTRTFSKCKTWLYRYPEESKKLLHSVSILLAKFLIAQYRAGAQLLQVFESWGGELPQHVFKEFVLPELTYIVDTVKKEIPQVPMTVFGRGLGHALESLAATKFDVVGLDWSIDPKDARRRVGSNVSLQGNLDPCALYVVLPYIHFSHDVSSQPHTHTHTHTHTKHRYGTRESLRKEVRYMLSRFGSTQRHIANLGHGMHPTHDPEMAGEFIKAVQEESLKMRKNE